MNTEPLRNRWQFWGLVVYVLLVVLTPSLAADPDWEIGAINAAVVGILLICLAGFELGHHYFWTDAGQLLLGLWLATSPYFLGYGGGQIGQWHLGVGTLVAALAIFSLFRERSRTRSRI